MHPQQSAVTRLTKLRAFKWPTVAYEIQKNLRSRAREGRGGLWSITAFGSQAPDPRERVAYSRIAFGVLRQHPDLEQDSVAGLRVLELGPGEDLCVALRFLAAGAASVACIDRFLFHVDPAWERALYRALLEDLDAQGRQRLSDVLSPDGELIGERSRLEVVRGVGIEEGAERFGDHSFDLIVSVAVLEHVYDLEAALRAMDSLLVPGGLMVHQVDLRDHGMFSNGGRHPLEFLTLGERTYRLMTSHTGAPNRERIGTYRNLLGQLGHELDLLVTNVGGSREDLSQGRATLVMGRDIDPAVLGSIDALRGRMAPRFAALPTEELAATGVLMRSRKTET